jgi:hypothetical protein
MNKVLGNYLAEILYTITPEQLILGLLQKT